MRITDYIKNGLGPHTKRKIICFSVDDYGVQRTASTKSLLAMEKAGMDMRSNRFDRLDSLETSEDLSMLWDTLSSVRDKNGNPAIFTAFACPANIDFEYVRGNDGKDYKFILLPKLYDKMGMGDVMGLWHQGRVSKVVDVQYHGREHTNIKTLLTLLREKDPQALAAVTNDSWSGITHRISDNISYVSAAQFEDASELPGIADILVDGTTLFKEVWGYKPEHFTSPGNRENSYVHRPLAEAGVKYIDTNFMFKEHQGNGVYKRKIHLPFSQNKFGQHFIIRNCVFEPMLKCPSGNWEDWLMGRISSMFSLGKPANISTHRVNFAGALDPCNRETHLKMLGRILKRIVSTWPEVEFMSTTEMAKVLIPQRT